MASQPVVPIPTDGAGIEVSPFLARRVAEPYAGADGRHQHEPALGVGLLGPVTAVCVLQRRRPDAGTAGWSAMAKGPVPAAEVTALGLVGDEQADREHHGGPDKAVYAMDGDEVDHWTRTVPGLGVGGMGENLVVGGRLDDVELGARLWVGSGEPGGDGVLLRVTGVRNPCPTFARGMGRGDWVSVFSARNRVGVYLAVETPGTVRPGDQVWVWSTPGHQVSCRRWFAHHDPDDAWALLAAEADGRMVLADFTRRYTEAAAASRSSASAGTGEQALKGAT